MLIINNELVSQLLTMDDCIRVQEEAFRKIPTGGAIHRPRIDMYVPAERPDGYFRWGTMEGANDGFFAIRMKSDIITWPRDENGNWTEEKYCREPGTYCGLILLVSTRNAEPLAFINDGILQHFRVGGGAGIGVKYLSREDTHVVGMLGSGGMARSHVETLIQIRNIKRIQVYSPTKANREKYAAEMTEKERIYHERYPIDDDFIAALRVMPAACGVALGFDRLVMLATGATRIDQVMWTPVAEPCFAWSVTVSPRSSPR